MTSTSASSTTSVTPPNSKSGSIKRAAGTMSITKELEENVTGLLGSSTKILVKAILKLEQKNDKLENRLLVFSPYRLYIFTVKGSPKLEHSFNYVDISAIESKKASYVSFDFQSDSRHYIFHSCDPFQEEIDRIICHLATTLKALFPHVPLESFIRKLEVEPRSRLETVHNYVHSVEERIRFGVLDILCGGFSSQYACFCDYYNAPYREEVSWDIDTIYASHNNTELSIFDFEHLEVKDLLPIIAALSYNGWFTKLRVSNYKLVNTVHPGSDQLCDHIINLVRKSTTLEEIYFDNTGIRADFVNKLFSAMLLNNQTSIRIIDLSNNPIEDKGLKSITAFVAKSFHMANSALNSSTDDLSSSLSIKNSSYSQSISLSGNKSNASLPITSAASAKLMYKGLVHLNLSHTGITSKGISELSESLYLNKSMFSTLSYLNLSDNVFKDDATKLYSFLAQPNNLSHLDMSGTDCNLEILFGALLHGCTNNLVHLNLARNQFSSKKSSHRDATVPAAIKKFFSTAIFLRTINLSHNKLPPEVLKAVLLGLACNESATDIRINLSSNEFKSTGATVLELTLTDIRCISGLDLSDNALDMDLIGVINSISKNKAIKYLSIGRNFNNIKAKHLSKVLDAFVQMLQDPECSIESLSLVDSKLRADTSIILNALGSNQSLVNIDVSGNQMGLAGAKTLAKALQVNTRLETIYLDRNLIPTNGFIDIAYALERNFTLRYLPLPIQDVQVAMMKLPERTEAAITKIQEYIRKNNLPQTAIIRNLRLHSLTNSNLNIDSSLFSKIERISSQLQQIIPSKQFDQLNRISSVDSIEINLNSEQDNTIVADEFLDDFSRIESLLRDAQNIRLLLNKIQNIYSPVYTSNGYSGDQFSKRFSSARPIEASIAEFAKELKHTFEAHVVSVSELMIQCVKEEFPQVFAQSHRLELDLKDLYQGSIGSNINSNSSLIPSIEYFQMCLTESSGATWSVKLEQILHTIASQICNRVLLEMNQCLSNAHQILTGCSIDSKSSDMSSGNYLFMNGTLNQLRGSTPDVLRTRTWVESSSSHDSTDLNLSISDAQLLGNDDSMWLAWLNLATPKCQNQKRQNVYIRKLRPQSVLDGAIVPNENFPDLLLKTEPDPRSQLSNDSSQFDDSPVQAANGNHVQHLTKMRPRNRKTRAPTRVTLIDSKGKTLPNATTKLDEGLDGFFSTIPLFPSSTPSLASIESKDTSLSTKEPSASYSAKPQLPQKKMFSKFTFKSQCDQSSPHVEPVLRQQSVESSQLVLKNESLVRSSSPMGKRSEHVSICSETETGRVHSPLAGTDLQHCELLAEMRAKQEKRQASTPVNEQLTMSSSLEKRVSPEQPASTSVAESDPSSVSVAKRATIFGELHKSPSRVSINHTSQGDECPSSNGTRDDSSHEKTSNHNGSAASVTPTVRQRPKSMVGMLQTKFEILNSSSNK